MTRNKMKMMLVYAKTYKRRCAILGIPVPDYKRHGGIASVDITREQLELLFAEDFIEPSDMQNEAPTAQEFLEFLRENPSFYAIGYIVSPDRDDYRVSIEGVEARSCTTRELARFRKTFREADEYREKPPRAWYD